MTDEQIDALIAKTGWRAEDPSGEVASMLRAIFRAGLREAARIADEANAAAGYSLPFIAGDAIRAAAGDET